MDKIEREREAATFSARLTPHRSLGPKGFFVLMCAVSSISFTAGMVFWLAGAWPVFFFFGLDVLLVYWAFRINYAAANAWETVEIAGDRLTVERHLPGRRRGVWEFHPYWVKVELQDPRPDNADDTLDLCGPLWLRSHGRSLEIGAFLSPAERRELAHALNAALAAQRR